MPEPETKATREFAPLYTPTGNENVDRLAFFHILERLKTQKRTGWVDNNATDLTDSISDHMYRMAILAMCASDPTLDITKCVLMCLVHDLAEAHVGDIAPREGIPKETKAKLEADAMDNFVNGMLHGSPAGRRMEALWKEYEEGKSPEARFVKDLDRFEMASQALEYERRCEDKDLEPFFESSIPKLRHPEVAGWGDDLMEERENMKKERQDSNRVS
ncbi:HD domain-containing protein [Schizopora paradoxa]|uniref:5'-deoxynucleotidase n=1 Tax=Schizopora paradoxa TaxID=27342 RepID=A0A0H2RV11_9AGAM|nr:HD domain-containing protein [Schizopora paradoxa]